MVSSDPRGLSNAKSPVKPTLAERFVSLFHIPYWIGCVFVAFVLMGLPLQLAVAYLGSFDLGKAVSSVSPHSASLGVATFFVGLLYFYVLYAPHYMRGRLLQDETSISSWLPGGGRGFYGLFGSISMPGPQVAIWVVFFAVLVANSFVPASLSISYIYVVFISAVLGLGSSSMLWTYIVALRGIHRIGGVHLALRPYYEDKTQGLKQVGYLALSLALTYFVGLGLGLSLAILYNLDLLLIYPFFAAVIILGVLMFFLPLVTLHNLMKKNKQVEMSKLSVELGEIYGDTKDHKVDMAQAFLLDLKERKVSSMPTWPFDLDVLSRLILIVLSLVSVILAVPALR